MTVFILDSSKLNEIIYNMENQNKNSSIIISSGEILYPEDGIAVDRADSYPLPRWGSVEGFKIMNEFVSQLKNPIVTQELETVLKLGHGVFRKFKNVLKGSPEVERVWYSFKKDGLKNRVFGWYNEIREYAGLKLFSEDDFEDNEDLLDFDFSVRKAAESDFEFIKKWDLVGFYELYSNYPKEVIDDMYRKKRDGLLDLTMLVSDFLYIAENPLGEAVGFVWATGYTLCNSFTGMDLLQLCVVPEYQGLGLGKMLLNKILEKYREGDYKDFIVNCQGKSSWIISYLELEGYKLSFQELSFRL